MSSSNKLQLPVLSLFTILLVGIVAWVDFLLPRGTAAGTLYVVVVLFTWLFPRLEATISVTIVCVFLITIGYLLSDQGVAANIAILNRIFSVLAVLTTAFLMITIRISMAKQDLAKQNLDEKVRTRTEALEGRVKEAERKHELFKKTELALVNVLEDLKENREELKINKERLEQIYEFAPDVFFSADPITNKVIRCNSSAIEKTEYPREDIQNCEVSSLFDEDCKEEIENALALLSQEGEVSNVELQLKKRSGQKLDIILNAAAIKNAKQKVESYFFIARDISDIRETEKKFEALLRAAPDPTVIINEKGEIELINSQLEKVFGYQKEELQGEKVEILIPNRFLSIHQRVRQNYMNQPTVRSMGTELELFGKRKNGSEFAVEVSLSPLKSETGNLIIATIRDITDRKKAELRLQNSYKELEQFAYIASHDLQEPLRKVIAFGGRLQHHAGKQLDEKSTVYLEKMTESVTRMQGFIDDLLTYSRVLKSDPKSEEEEVDINKVLKEIESDYEYFLEQNNGQIHCRNELPKIVANRVLVRQVFQNLIGNGLKFQKEGSTPKVELWSETKPNGQIRIMISDNGIGFDEKFTKRIFQPFKRLHSRGEYKGSGLGLAICNKIVTSWGGELQAHSELGKGSIFVIELNAQMMLSKQQL